MGRHPLSAPTRAGRNWREPLRWAPLVFAVLCLDVVAAVGLRLRRVHGPVALDVRTAQPVFSHAFGVSLVPVRMATQFVKLGNPVPYAALVLALVVLAASKHDWLSAATAATGPVLAVFTAEHLKPHFGRTEGGADACPSGHNTALTALAVVVVLVVWRRRGWRSVAVTGPLAAVMAGGMVLTVVRLHAHLMSDALAGVFLGAGIVTGIACLLSLAPSAGGGFRATAVGLDAGPPEGQDRQSPRSHPDCT